MEKLKENSENNQNLDETINSENDKEPFIIGRRNPLAVLFETTCYGVVCLAGFNVCISNSSILGCFVFIVFLYFTYATISFEYLKSYSDKIVIKRYFFREIIILRKDIVREIHMSSRFIIGAQYTVLVKRKIGARFFLITCLSDNQNHKI
ncbi:hypothetical protein OFN97_05120 [Campylobacter sp. VBCF_05 NA6]|uniref:hypothetical protein n=1 Tax=unclassified Campylobacter TaxID=2593542 RepID=UPI0022E9E5BF|nr:MULTISPECIES: hypothetical protein [unclassified Campylobacter]MDA3058052.1 hypothetical protein [Campylobacter sp. VBCF_04 NA7]MDA3059393.1 hypothetical protein [Campylobacter sp. VBCF_05 NA6]